MCRLMRRECAPDGGKILRTKNHCIERKAPSDDSEPISAAIYHDWIRAFPGLFSCGIRGDFLAVK